MKKNILSSAMILGFSITTYAQVGVNTKTPNSIFDVSAKRDASGAITDNGQVYGLQAPRLTRAELSANSTLYGADQNGALIYITDISGGNANATSQRENVTVIGYYYFDATAASNAGRWQKVANGTVGSAYTASNGLTLSGNNMKLGGSLTEPTTISAITATNKLSFTGTGVDAINFDSGTLSIDATNNRLGINTTAPQAFLHIMSPTPGTSIDSAVFGIDNCGQACHQSTARNVVLYNGNTTNTDFSSIDFVPASDPTKPSGAVIKGIDRDVTNNYAGLAFLTRNSSGFDNRVVIRSSGNVGIGTYNPATKLEINNGSVNGAIKIVDGTQGTGKVLTSDNDGLATWQTPTSYTVSNGLTMSGSNTKLGGSLTQNTTIAQGNYSMNFSGNSNVNISTTNTSSYPVSITHPLTSNLSTPGLQIGGASGTPVTGQAAFIGFNPNNFYGAWPISIGAQYINGSSRQGDADFFIATSSGGSADKKLVVKNNGNVGIGTTNPSYLLDISGGGGTVMRILNGGDLRFTADNDNSKGVDIYVPNGSNNLFTFAGWGTGGTNATMNLTTGAVTGSSDLRLKENIKNIDNITERLMKLRPVTYNYKTDKTTSVPGLIAQEVDKVFPDTVVRPKTENDYYSLYYQYFTPYLIKGFQEQQKEIEQLKKENAGIAELRLIIKELQSDLEKLKKSK